MHMYKPFNPELENNLNHKLNLDGTKLDNLITYPCDFTIKIMGINNAELIPEVIRIIRQYAKNFDPDTGIVTRLSNKNNYLAISATIIANSREQLDKIYLALNQHNLVKITL